MLELAKTLGLRWSSPRFIALASLALLAGGLATAASIFPNGISLTSGAVATMPAWGLWGLWWRDNRLPRAPRGKIPVLVGITAETPAQRTKIRADFVPALREGLLALSRAEFVLLELPERFLTDSTSYEDLATLSRRVGALLIVHLHGRMRTLEQEAHVVDLRASLSHRTIPTELQQDLFGTFANDLPRKWIVDVTGDFLAFEAAGQWLDLVARYYAAMVALLAIQFREAEELLGSVERDVRRLARELGPLRKQFAKRLPAARLKVLEWEMMFHSHRFRTAHEESDLEAVESAAVRIHELKPNHPHASSNRALASFYLRRDVDSAVKHINRCTGSPRPEWRYGRAFLRLWCGDVNLAEADYDAAFRLPVNRPWLVNEILEFLDLVLREHPEKFELHYGLGLINYHVQEDYRRAAEEMGAFLRECPEDQHEGAQRRARRVIESCGPNPDSSSN